MIFEKPLWYDSEWLNNRFALLKQFDFAHTIIDFRGCEWIDLQPLIDILLQINKNCRMGRKVTLELYPPHSEGAGRVLRFLFESGFIHSLEKDQKWIVNLEVQYAGKKYSPQEMNRLREKLELPARALDFATIVPCTVINGFTFETRDSIFEYCNNLKEKIQGNSKSSTRSLPMPLFIELKVFFDSVLPELIDNVRIHKKNGSDNIASFYMRVRRRTETLYLTPRKGFKERTALTVLEKNTEHFWQYDFLEAVFADSGLSIQESWRAGWQATKSMGDDSVPRMPLSGKRLDGPNADAMILAGVFEENMTSLSPTFRITQGIPPNYSGLFSIKRAIAGSNWYFSVRSGRDMVLIKPHKKLSENDDELFKTRLIQRVENTDGVQFSFRFAASQGRPLSAWIGISPISQIRSNEWWEDSYPKKLSEVKVINDYSIFSIEEKNSTIIFRPQGVPEKHFLYRFLKHAKLSNLNVVFAELAPPIALRLQLLIEDLIKSDKEISIICPIITSTLKISVPNDPNLRLARAFTGEKISNIDAWWQDWNSPICGIKDVFSRCREYDSYVFWDLLSQDNEAILRERIAWSNNRILSAGFVDISLAQRNPALREILKKRIINIIQALEFKELRPGGDILSFLVRDVVKSSFMSEIIDSPIGILGGVYVTGDNLKKPIRGSDRNKDIVELPILRYPQKYICGSTELNQENLSRIRVFDWNTQQLIKNENGSEKNANFKYHQVGATGKIRKKPDKPFFKTAFESFEDTFRIWQSQSLTRIGHLSTGKHHFFMWIDLYQYLNGPSAVIGELVHNAAEFMKAISPTAVFYYPDETSEIFLIALLTEYKKRVPKTEQFSIFPFSVQGESVSVGARPIDQIQEVQKAAFLGSRNAVFVNDAIVSGETLRSIGYSLKMIGFSRICSINLLDRKNPFIEMNIDITGENEKKYEGGKDNKSNHFSWWSAYIPPTGTVDSCRICHGIEKINLISSRCPSETIERIYLTWITYWEATQNIHENSTKVEIKRFDPPIMKKFGNPINANIIIKSSEALLFWAVDIMSRLRYFSYPLEKHEGIQFCKTELISALIFMFWKEISISEREKALKILIDQVWSEDRPSARSLAAVAIASLPLDDLKSAVKYVKNNVAAYGFPSLDVGAIAFIIARLVSEPVGEKTETILNTWREAIPQVTSTYINEYERARGLLNLLSGLEGGKSAERIAIQVLGLPGRGHGHDHLRRRLDLLRKSDLLPTELLHELIDLKTHLEPITKILNTRRSLFEKDGVIEDYEKTMKEINNISGSVLKINKIKYRQIDPILFKNVMGNMYDVLFLGSANKLSIRRILIREYIHYLPFAIRTIIKEMVSSNDTNQEKCEITDFFIKNEITEGENILLYKGRITEKESIKWLEVLQGKDVVCMNMQYLRMIMSDFLQDVKHIKRHGNGMGENGRSPYMIISIENNKSLREQSECFLLLTIKNRSSKEQAKHATERSWTAGASFLKEIGVFSHTKYSSYDNMLARYFYFPYIKERGIS